MSRSEDRPRERRGWAHASFAALGVCALAGAGVALTGGGEPEPASATPLQRVATTGARPAPADGAAVPTKRRAAAVLALGDSVPAGLACDCRPFVDVYARWITPAHGPAAKSRNEAASGATSADVLDQLDERDVQAGVRDATTVLIMVGANDFGDAFRAVGTKGVSPARGFSDVAESVRANVTTIIKRIRALNGRAHIAVLDYWNTEMDGDAARKAYSARENSAAEWATRYANRALRSAAGSQQVWYVSTFVSFKGKDGRTDPTPLLADDGDHPNAAGHRAIARALTHALPAG